MNSYDKTLEEFINTNEEKLLDEYKEAFICEQASHSKINWEGLPTCDDSFVEWVEEKYSNEINAQEDQSRVEEYEEPIDFGGRKYEEEAQLNDLKRRY